MRASFGLISGGSHIINQLLANLYCTALPVHQSSPLKDRILDGPAQSRTQVRTQLVNCLQSELHRVSDGNILCWTQPIVQL